MYCLAEHVQLISQLHIASSVTLGSPFKGPFLHPTLLQYLGNAMLQSLQKNVPPLMFIYVHIVLMWLSFRVEHSTIVPLLSISEEPSEVE